MAWQALLPVLTEALAAFGVTAEAAAAGTAARAAATGATAAAEATAATGATGASQAAGGATSAAANAANAAGAKAGEAAAESTKPTISQMFNKLWESFAGKSAEKAAAETARNQSLSDAYLGATGGTPFRDHQSPSDKAAQDAATKIKDRVIGGATAMGTSLAANAGGSIIGGAFNSPGPSQNAPTGRGPLSDAFAMAGSGSAGQRVADFAQGGLTKAYDAAMAVPGPLFKPALQIADKVSDFTPGVAQMKAAGEAAGELSKALVQLPMLMEGWGRELLASQQHLARFNGNIAATFAEAERRDMLRSVESGQNTSMTTGKLSEALDGLKDEIQPFKDVTVNGFNVLASIGIQGVTAIVTTIKAMNPLIGRALDAHEAFLKQEAKNPPFVEFMRTVAKKELPNPRARRS